ncbi:MAG: hypothetical protein OQJ81_09720 [Melioribacteraceae bacterium]|nr:hypothetical protein [Melioribacteraceae bacterium]
MINGKLKYFFIFLFTFSLYNAQVKIHKSLTTEDGIASNRIFCIFEDSKGYMWFGTNNGVSRWDGINFKNFYTLNGLGGSQVFDIKEGPDGKIYFATYGKGITVYNNDSLYILNKDNGLLSNWVTKILVRLNGDIIFAAENGLISGIRNNKIVNIKEELGFGNNNIWSLFESKDSTLYLGSFKLFRYRNKKLNEFSHEDSYASSASFQTIYAIGEDHANNLFIGTLNGIHKFENEKLHKLKINGQPYSNSAVSIITALDGTMYFCGDNGVLVKDENHFDLLGKNDGLTDNNIWSAFEDSNGIIYFGTRDQGINIYYPNKLETYLNDKLNNISITAISQDTMNNLYFGTTNGLLLNNKQSIVRKLNKRTINTISLGNQNQIYVGTNEGFHILQNGSFKNFNLVPNPSALNKVWTINYSKTNKLLIGFQGGLYNFADNKLEKLSSLKGHNQFIQDVISIHDSTIVVGTHGRGLNFYKNGKETNFSLENGLTDNIINCLHETSDSLLLVGSDQGGLNILQNQFLLRTITLNDGLTSNTIFDINEDKNGNIYLSTSKGLNILDNLLDTLSIRTILSNNGLVSNSCNLNATYIDKIGNIWIGTNNGVTKYNPNADKPVTNPPKIYLTGLEIFNEPYPIKLLSTENELNYDQNYLKFI